MNLNLTSFSPSLRPSPSSSLFLPLLPLSPPSLFLLLPSSALSSFSLLSSSFTSPFSFLHLFIHSFPLYVYLFNTSILISWYVRGARPRRQKRRKKDNRFKLFLYSLISILSLFIQHHEFPFKDFHFLVFSAVRPKRRGRTMNYDLHENSLEPLIYSSLDLYSFNSSFLTICISSYVAENENRLEVCSYSFILIQYLLISTSRFFFYF